MLGGWQSLLMGATEYYWNIIEASIIRFNYQLNVVRGTGFNLGLKTFMDLSMDILYVISFNIAPLTDHVFF